MKKEQAEVIQNNNELIAIVEKSGLEMTKGQRLLEMFTPYFNKMAEIEGKINSLNSVNPGAIDVKMAREIRLALKNNRVASEKVKEDTKAMILIEGRLIDNLNNIVKNTSKGLEMQCESIEKFAEIQEQKRKEERKAHRLELLKPYEPEEGYFQSNYDLLNMGDDAFDNLLSGTKLNYEAKKEAERKAEAERIAREKAEAEERERMRQENERLKKEAIERERLAEIERKKQEKKLAEQKAKAEAERKALEEKARKEAIERERLAEIERKKQEKKLAEQKAKAEAERKALEEKARKEAIERERLEKELETKKKAEEERLAKIEAEKKAKAQEEKKLAMQPDKKKLESFAEFLQTINMPDVKSKEAKEIVNSVQELLNKVTNFIQTKIKNL
jgi:hypothetical protein